MKPEPGGDTGAPALRPGTGRALCCGSSPLQPWPRGRRAQGGEGQLQAMAPPAPVRSWGETQWNRAERRGGGGGWGGKRMRGEEEEDVGRKRVGEKDGEEGREGECGGSETKRGVGEGGGGGRRRSERKDGEEEEEGAAGEAAAGAHGRAPGPPLAPGPLAPGPPFRLTRPRGPVPWRAAPLLLLVPLRGGPCRASLRGGARTPPPAACAPPPRPSAHPGPRPPRGFGQRGARAVGRQRRAGASREETGDLL